MREENESCTKGIIAAEVTRRSKVGHGIEEEMGHTDTTKPDVSQIEERRYR